MVIDFPLFGGYGKRQDFAFDQEDLCNLFTIKFSGGKKEYAYLRTPGLSLKKDLKTDNGRALYVFNENVMIGVFGATVYTFNNTLVNVNRGNLSNDEEPISIVSNNASQVMIVDGVSGFIYDVNAGTLTKITSPGFPGQPLNVVFFDGYFVVPSLQGNKTQFFISALNDGLTWDALDFALIQTYPGYLIGVGVVSERLFFFKNTSTEVWYNAGAADFPFRQDKNLIFNYGCLTRNSIQSGFGYLFWLSSNDNGVGSVMMTMGSTPVPISDNAIDSLISSFSNPSNMDSYIYKDLDTVFYVMSWTDDDVTLVYNVTMKEWGRMSMQQNPVVPGKPFSGKTRHIANCHAYFNNKHYVASYKSSSLYEFSRAYYSNVGEIIPCLRVTKNLFDPAAYRRVQINAIQIDMQMGIGAENGEGFDEYEPLDYDPVMDPQMYLSIAKNNSPVFGNSIPQPIGKIGNFQNRMIWRKKGVMRNCVCKFEMFAPVGPVAILGGSLNYEVLAS